ncbi:hypothetical protein MKZ38_001991 [Zalerion maritima]|uniref:FK506-binding protein n=1 Tax=Zalerion maritima TaxID=339359 RepID=A0AAD5RQF4_9PEZI|nr:hypothetical protein MKZ38_001991 [Zalerion maritima]
MSHGYTARATWALEVPAGDILVPADKNLEFPVSIRISMAAIDPTADPVVEEGEDKPRIPRSTLKIVRLPPMMDNDSEEDELTEDQLEELRALIGNDSDSDSDSDSDDEPKAGPSNSKSKKHGAKKLIAALEGTTDDSDEEMEDVKPNGTKKNKGKAPATGSDDESGLEIDSDSDDDDAEPEIAVLCTLDTERNYQQPLDVILPADENVGFIVSGTHSVFLTGNLVTHYEDEEDSDEEADSDYDLEPDSDELLEDSSDEEIDALDNQRITEVDTDDEEDAPKLVAAAKGSKKRPAEDEAESLDGMIQAEKFSKKQLKKMKTNKGDAVPTKEAKSDKKKEETKAEKKVQFAKNLEQGPTGSEAKKADQKKATSAVTIIKGVKIDDRKIGQGRKVKNGDKVGVRYIGKLENGKQFDANKKGPPFTFKVGKGEVIKGWETGIQGMALGGERRLTVPPSMAYGSTAGLPGIPPNSTLVFDVKLLEIK